MDYSIEISNEQVLELFNRLLATGQDMSPVMSTIGATLENRVRQRFETKTDPTGAPWAPWKPSTIKSYPHGGNKKLLNRFGDMLGSLSHQVNGNSVLVGFGAVASNGFSYPGAHEFGTAKMERRGLLTADPVAGTLGAGDEEAILGVLRAALQNTSKG